MVVGRVAGAGSRVAGTLIGVGVGMSVRGVLGVVRGVRWWRAREAEAGHAAWQRCPEPRREAEGWTDPWDVWGRDE